jgi:hypothetical protein
LSYPDRASTLGGAYAGKWPLGGARARVRRLRGLLLAEVCEPIYGGVELGPMGLAWQVEAVCHRCGHELAEPAVVEVVNKPSPAEIAKLLRNFTAPLVDAGWVESAA